MWLPQPTEMDRRVNSRINVDAWRSEGALITAEPIMQVPAGNMRMEVVENGEQRLSPLLELTIVGGLGVFIMIAPNVVEFAKQKIKTRIFVLKNRVGHAKIAKRLEMLNRRRKYGSLVRVIGSVLPSSLFAPPCRIYIPNWAQLENKQWDFHPLLTLPVFEPSEKADLPSENDVGDGLIEAFEINSEVLSFVSEDDVEEHEDEDTASSSPEGWTQEQRKFTGHYNPTLMNATDSSFARCSTPKANVETLHFNASQIVHQQGSRIYEDQGEITELKKMVEGLMLQINCLNQSLLTTQNQLAAQQQQIPTPTLSVPEAPSTPQPVAPLPRTAASIPPGPPPPPPPPPPPMPPMPSLGNKPLVITKKGNQEKLLEKKPQVSLMDVLKELPNAKLRRIERSPGGTPLKPQLKLANERVPLDIGNQLAFALKKRYESMHSPLCETDTDKENVGGSDDSFEDTPPNSAKRVLFPVMRSPRRKSNGNRREENQSPFGQHLLKKRINLPIKNEVTESSPPVIALRQQN